MTNSDEGSSSPDHPGRTDAGTQVFGSDASVVVERAVDMDEIRVLFNEYQAFLGIDLCFQNFEQELADLPGKYAPPAGALLIARRQGALAGCVGLRPIDATRCEMKRLYVRPQHRGFGLGRTLAGQIIACARQSGYESMWLDTFSYLDAAMELYRFLEFEPAEPYCANPEEAVVYLRKLL